MKKIDIQSVLNEMHILADAKGNTRLFGLRFIKSNGEMREIKNCRRNVKKSWQRERAEIKGKMNYNLKYSGIVLIYNEDTGETRSVKAAHMIAFRPHGRKDWVQIWH